MTGSPVAGSLVTGNLVTGNIWRVALAAALLLSGCASIPPPAGAAPWTTGRLSLRVEATAQQPAQSLSVAFELRGSGDFGELRLNSPLGTQLVAATWVPGQATRRTPQGERRFGSLEELSRQALGEPLPLSALSDWLTGRPWPGAVHTLKSEGFEQLGWLVITQRFTEGWVSAQRVMPPAVMLRVKLDREP